MGRQRTQVWSPPQAAGEGAWSSSGHSHTDVLPQGTQASKADTDKQLQCSRVLKPCSLDIWKEKSPQLCLEMRAMFTAISKQLGPSWADLARSGNTQ